MTYNITRPHKQISDQLEYHFRNDLWVCFSDQLKNSLSIEIRKQLEFEVSDQIWRQLCSKIFNHIRDLQT